MPVRCDALPYVNVTCSQVIKTFLDDLDKFGISYPHVATLNDWLTTHTGEAIHFEEGIDKMTIEMLDLEATKGNFAKVSIITDLFGEYPVLVSNDHFKDLTSDTQLPVIARNHLENGISQNLWYEQVLPRQSRFYFIVLTPDDNKVNKFIQFNDKIEIKKELIQIGGNASIGYGFSKISQI